MYEYMQDKTILLRIAVYTIGDVIIAKLLND